MISSLTSTGTINLEKKKKIMHLLLLLLLPLLDLRQFFGRYYGFH
jgi:hypothetical protein